MYYTKYKSPFCDVILVADDIGLRTLYLCTGDGKKTLEISPDWERNDSVFSDTVKQLDEYFEGKRQVFDVKLNLVGTEFQRRVWLELAKIPFGEVRSYKDIAVAIGKPNACRAVGMANSKNPVTLIIPCHRVVGTNGKLTGFASGLAIKEKLLDFEAKEQ